MPTALDVQCLIVLQAAASAELGIVITTNNPTKARASIYAARQKLGDPELAGMQIRVSPNDSEHEIWLINTAKLNWANTNAGSNA